MLTLRKLTITLAVAIVLLVAVATLVAHYAATGEHNEPPQRARGL